MLHHGAGGGQSGHRVYYVPAVVIQVTGVQVTGMERDDQTGKVSGRTSRPNRKPAAFGVWNRNRHIARRTTGGEDRMPKNRIFAVIAGCAALAAGVMGLLLAGLGAANAADLVGVPVPWSIDLQEAASPTMDRIRSLNYLLSAVIIAITIFVFILMAVIVLRFNAKKNPTPSQTTHNSVLEVLWTVVPVIILVIIAIPSFKLLYYADRTQEAEMTVKATGHQWYWEYTYQDTGVKGVKEGAEVAFESVIACRGDGSAADKKSCDEFEAKHGRKPVRLLDTDTQIVLPVGTNIRLLITAAPEGVLHSWAIPSFGVKLDAVPGRINETWVRIDKPGIYFGQCSELCGKDHGFMPITVKAVSKADYATWVQGQLSAQKDGGTGTQLARKAATK